MNPTIYTTERQSQFPPHHVAALTTAAPLPHYHRITAALLPCGQPIPDMGGCSNIFILGGHEWHPVATYIKHLLYANTYFWAAVCFLYVCSHPPLFNTFSLFLTFSILWIHISRSALAPSWYNLPNKLHTTKKTEIFRRIWVTLFRLFSPGVRSSVGRCKRRCKRRWGGR